MKDVRIIQIPLFKIKIIFLDDKGNHITESGVPVKNLFSVHFKDNIQLRSQGVVKVQLPTFDLTAEDEVAYATIYYSEQMVKQVLEFKKDMLK